ncbi:Transmembrane protein 68 [Chelonia mydas]|uniref:Transmembrane protein 68 n=1 Tax=Chelonia mydas TaxID=8469 RepID=M7BUJ4_CHEMY|nr:Transmembrane protein 68 [Chelonia mydas]
MVENGALRRTGVTRKSPKKSQGKPLADRETLCLPERLQVRLLTAPSGHSSPFPVDGSCGKWWVGSCERPYLQMLSTNGGKFSKKKCTVEKEHKYWCGLINFRIARHVMDCYEVHGIEKIPEGPGLIVYYHGAASIDYHFFVCNLYIQKGRVSYSVVERLLYMIPGLQLYFKLLTAVNGGREQCVEILKKGNLLGVAPGGARESFFSDENYGVLWGNRKGFAQVAIDAKVPIIPLFTQNIREGYRTLGTTWFIRWLDERFRLPFVPLYGGFPVKLRTYIGDPIPYDPNITATELVEKTKIAIEALRDRHQKLPGNILRALLERFDKHQKDD